MDRADRPISLHSQTLRSHTSPYLDRQTARVVPEDDNSYIPSKALSTDHRSKPSAFSHYTTSPAGKRSVHGPSLPTNAGIAPAMPEGEEYDSDTEAERQAAWAEYYRLMATNQITADFDSMGGEADQAEQIIRFGLDLGGYLEE